MSSTAIRHRFPVGMHGFRTCVCALALVLVLAFTGFAQAGGHRLVCDIWPPYQMTDGDEVRGFSVEVVRRVYENMGVEIEFIRHYPWARALSELSAGHADALFSANITVDRMRYARFPLVPLTISPWVVWSRQGRPLTSLEELAGSRVGIVRGYSYSRTYREFVRKHCEAVPVANDEQCFRMLAAGRIDATAAELHNGIYLVGVLGLRDISPNVDVVIKNTGLYVMFNRRSVDAAFVQKFSDALAAFKKTDEHDALMQRFFHVVFSPPEAGQE